MISVLGFFSNHTDKAIKWCTNGRSYSNTKMFQYCKMIIMTIKYIFLRIYKKRKDFDTLHFSCFNKNAI